MRFISAFFLAIAAAVFAVRSAEPLFPVCKEGLWGFIDRSGTLRITPRFDEIWRPFNALIPLSEKDCELRCWSEDRLVARKGTLWGLADLQGEWVVPPKFRYATHLNGGWAGVMVEHHWAFIGADGKVVLDLEQTRGGYLFSEDRAPVVREIGGKARWGFVDRQGRETIPARFDEVRSFHEGLAPAREGVKWGYLNREGQWAIAPQFDDGDYFFERRARVVKDGKAGFIAPDGQWLAKPVYEQAQRFAEGLAAVSTDRRCGFVDTAGKLVIPMKFKDARSFREGLAAAAEDRLYGYIDREGKWAIAPQFELAEAFHDGLAAVCKDERFGFIDRSGKVVVPFQFDEVRPFADGLAEVRLDEKWGYIDEKGTYVWAPSD